MVDLSGSIFGSKADTAPAGQAADLTAAAGADWGIIPASIEGTRLGPPPHTLRALALRLRADCSPRVIGRHLNNT